MKDALYRMIDVSPKRATFRKAAAFGRIYLKQQAFNRVRENSLPKGDSRLLAEVAGINGAKGAALTIPLCHPLTLDHVQCTTYLEEELKSVAVVCVVSAFAKTGVEMEALAGVNAALLAIYDLCKMIEPALSISDVRLLVKSGGKTGLWKHPEPLPPCFESADFYQTKNPLFAGINVATLTASTRAAKGEYDDKSGQNLKTLCVALGAKIQTQIVCEDEPTLLEKALKRIFKEHAPDLIITTGGTGLSPTDVTPEVLKNFCQKEIPGIGELLRTSGAQHISTSWLSRSFAGIIGQTLIIALPGNPNAVTEGIEALKEIIPHAISLIRGENAHA